jgi:hypothetical protein
MAGKVIAAPQNIPYGSKIEEVSHHSEGICRLTHQLHLIGYI